MYLGTRQSRRCRARSVRRGHFGRGTRLLLETPVPGAGYSHRGGIAHAPHRIGSVGYRRAEDVGIVVVVVVRRWRGERGGGGADTVEKAPLEVVVGGTGQKQKHIRWRRRP